MYDTRGSWLAATVRRLTLFDGVEPVGMCARRSPAKTEVATVLAWSWIENTVPRLRLRRPTLPLLSTQAMPRAAKAVLRLSQVTTSAGVAAAALAKVPLDTGTVGAVPTARTSPPVELTVWTPIP